MPRVLSLSWALPIALIALFITLPANAEPPARVGRVSLVNGTMTVAGTDGGSTEAAPVNYPVSTGMRFATAAGSRGELELGNVTARLDGRTELEVVALDDDIVALRLNAGSVDMRVRILFEGESVTIDTRDGQIAFTQPGAFRVDAAGIGSSASASVTHLVVFTGNAHIHSAHGDDDVFSGEGVDINGAAATMRYGQADTTWLDDWATAREQETASVVTERYVDPETAGAGDLDQAGTWDDTADYGPVWYPGDVPVDWAPYQVGSWAWVAPWGWTWIDARPWGFAPFHYGRWVRIDGRWGWWPGERHRHPAYAPAVVGFAGDEAPSRHTRPHGWVPLAPGQPYRPPYTHNDAYVRNINAGTLRVGPSNRADDHRRHDGDHDNDHPGTVGLSGRDDIAATPGRLSSPPSDDRRPEHGIQSPGNRVTDDQIIINNDTFRRPPRPDNFGSPVPGRAPGVTAMPLATPPPATPATPPAPITPMTTPPAGSYGRRPAWQSDPRLERTNPSPSRPVTAPDPIPTPQIQTPIVQQPQFQAPQNAQPRAEPAFQANPNRGFAPREMPRPQPQTPPPPRPSQNGSWQPRAATPGSGNVGQGNTGQGNTGQNGR